MMRISILLNNITHDQAARNGNEAAFVGWLHMPGAGPDAGNLIQQAEDGSRFGRRPLPRFSARREDWGGVVIHGPSMMVLEVDNQGYEVIEHLISGGSLDDALSRSNSLPEDIEDFRKFFAQHNL